MGLSVNLLAVAVGTAGIREIPALTVQPSLLSPGGHLVVRFRKPIESRAGSPKWIVVAPLGASDDYQEGRVMLGEGTTLRSLPVNAPGHFEIRLHEGPPDREHHVVGRVRMVVQPAEEILQAHG